MMDLNEQPITRGCCSLDQDMSSIPDPSITEIQLNPKDECLILANQALWKYISVTQAIQEVGQCEDSNAAAKRLTYLALSCGCTENLSVMVLNFNFTNFVKNSGNQRPSKYIRNKKNKTSLGYSHFGSLSEANMAVLDMNGLGASEPILNSENYDPLMSNFASSRCDMNKSPSLHKNWSSLCTFHSVTDEELQNISEFQHSDGHSERGTDDDSNFGCEAYKSWEYVLEQNHNLLFTRQLQTLHKSFKQTKHRMRSVDPGKWCNNHAAAAYGTICHYTRGSYPTYRGKYYYYNRPPMRIL